MKCMTAFACCMLLSMAYSGESNPIDTRKLLENMPPKTSASNTPDYLEQRKNALKTRNAKSYVSFMHEGVFICSGVLNTAYRAIAATTCVQKLLSCKLDRVISVIGLSRGYNTQPLYIDNAYPLETQPGLGFVDYVDAVQETDFIKASHVDSLLNFYDTGLIGYYCIMWSERRKQYFIENVRAFQYESYLYSSLPSNYPDILLQGYDSYILFEDGVIKGCSSDFINKNPITDQANEYFIRYEPVSCDN